MTDSRHILVADRNPHVRRLICRELAGAGFSTRPASTGLEVLRWSCNSRWADVLIIDPDLPDGRPDALLRQIAAERPDMPVILHTLSEPLRPETGWANPGFPTVEKAGNSIPRILAAVQAAFVPSA